MDFIHTDDAPQAIGPYSQAVKAHGFVFCSGQIPVKKDGTLIEGRMPDQTRQVLENLKAVLLASGSDFSKVVKTTVYLTDMLDFEPMNAVYKEYFGNHKPSRATVQVAALPKNALIEMDCIALADEPPL